MPRFILLMTTLILGIGLMDATANRLVAQSQTKGIQTPEGSQTKPTSGSDTRNRSQSGSSTRNDPRTEVDGSLVKPGDYVPPEPTQVDPSMLDSALVSAKKIDQLIDAKLKESKTRPNGKTKDLAFARRAYLDIAGTIPTGRQAIGFARYRGNRKVKRTQLIDELLNSKGYVSHSFNYWAEVLRLMDRGNQGENLRPYNDWVKDSIASDMPYDQFVTQLLSADGRVWENPPVGYTLRDRGMIEANLDNSMRIFLGTRIGCAQCHDHPFDEWTQKQFFELAAFIHGTETRHNRHLIDDAVKQARAQMDELPRTKENNNLRARIDQMIRTSEIWVGEKKGRKLRLPHDYKYDNGQPGDRVRPKVTFGEMPELQPNVPMRRSFAGWVTSPDNPRFTMAIVNRLWKRVFGIGLVEPIDNFTDVTEFSHPELIEFLVAEMKRVNYSQREFLRILYNTQAYSREAVMDDVDFNKPFYFAGPVMRRMTAAQLWDSMLTLTLADPDLYVRPRGDVSLKLISISPGKRLSLDELRAKYDASQSVDGPRSEERELKKVHSHEGYLLVRASEMKQPEDPGHFLRQFGQSDRTLISGGSRDGHVPQILTMFNGPISHKLLYEGTVIYDEFMNAGTVDDKIDVLFLSILSRHPTRLDNRIAARELESEGAAGVGNVIWSLLNTREFMFIH